MSELGSSLILSRANLDELTIFRPAISDIKCDLFFSVLTGDLMFCAPSLKEAIYSIFLKMQLEKRSFLHLSLVGRKIHNREKQIFTLPDRMRGANILNPCKTADKEYKYSVVITQGPWYNSSILKNQKRAHPFGMPISTHFNRISISIGLK